jgi:hypothetical protein
MEKSPTAPTACPSPPRLAPPFCATYAPIVMFSTCDMPPIPNLNPSCFSIAPTSYLYSSFDRTQNSGFVYYTTRPQKGIDSLTPVEQNAPNEELDLVTSSQAFC